MAAQPERRGGRGHCAACGSDRQDEINRAIATPRPSYRTLEKRFGISKTALIHHKQNHLTPAIVALAKTNVDARPILDDVRGLRDEAQAILVGARKMRNMQQALSAIRTALACLELAAKITGELDERANVTVNLQTTQEWIQIQAVVLEFIPTERRREFSRRLLLLDGGKT